MLGWAIGFLVIALLAGLFGFRGVEITAINIAQLLFFIFIILFIISVLFGGVLYPVAT